MRAAWSWDKGRREMLTVSASSSHMSEWVQNRSTTPTDTRATVATSAHSGGGHVESKLLPSTSRAGGRDVCPIRSFSAEAGGASTAAGVSSTTSIGPDGNYSGGRAWGGDACSLR